MQGARHVGIVGVSAEGAALGDRTICAEGAVLLGAHNHPGITTHTFPLAAALPSSHGHVVARPTGGLLNRNRGLSNKRSVSLGLHPWAEDHAPQRAVWFRK
jgi:hypothetical protein